MERAKTDQSKVKQEVSTSFLDEFAEEKSGSEEAKVSEMSQFPVGPKLSKQSHILELLDDSKTLDGSQVSVLPQVSEQSLVSEQSEEAIGSKVPKASIDYAVSKVSAAPSVPTVLTAPQESQELKVSNALNAPKVPKASQESKASQEPKVSQNSVQSLEVEGFQVAKDSKITDATFNPDEPISQLATSTSEISEPIAEPSKSIAKPSALMSMPSESIAEISGVAIISSNIESMATSAIEAAVEHVALDYANVVSKTPEACASTSSTQARGVAPSVQDTSLQDNSDGELPQQSKVLAQSSQQPKELSIDKSKDQSPKQSKDLSQTKTTIQPTDRPTVPTDRPTAPKDSFTVQKDGIAAPHSEQAAEHSGSPDFEQTEGLAGDDFISSFELRDLDKFYSQDTVAINQDKVGCEAEQGADHKSKKAGARKSKKKAASAEGTERTEEQKGTPRIKKENLEQAFDNKDIQQEPREPFEPKAFLKTLPNRPGSYRMYDANDVVIYVGKAKDLKKRLSSYFLKHGQSTKTKALVSNIARIEFTVTFSESEALILENELIKQYQPRYNILLRDDKSYPYILLTSKHEHPGLYYHRGAKRRNGEYFGPFPDSNAVKESLRLLQRIFPVRQCEDSVYSHRSRPCLMAQMGRCLAPCVAMSPEKAAHYQEQVSLLRLFLKGQNQNLLQTMVQKMEEHAERLEFEEAALLRDQLTALRRIQESNSILSDVDYPLDVIGHCMQDGLFCVHVLFIRQGRVLGSRSFFPKLGGNKDTAHILFSFLTQFYLNESHAAMLPDEILLDCNIQELTSQKVELSPSVLSPSGLSPLGLRQPLRPSTWSTFTVSAPAPVVTGLDPASWAPSDLDLILGTGTTGLVSTQAPAAQSTVVQQGFVSYQSVETSQDIATNQQAQLQTCLVLGSIVPDGLSSVGLSPIALSHVGLRPNSWATISAPAPVTLQAQLLMQSNKGMSNKDSSVHELYKTGAIAISPAIGYALVYALPHILVKTTHLDKTMLSAPRAKTLQPEQESQITGLTSLTLKPVEVTDNSGVPVGQATTSPFTVEQPTAPSCVVAITDTAASTDIAAIPDTAATSGSAPLSDVAALSGQSVTQGTAITGVALIGQVQAPEQACLEEQGNESKGCSLYLSSLPYRDGQEVSEVSRGLLCEARTQYQTLYLLDHGLAEYTKEDICLIGDWGQSSLGLGLIGQRLIMASDQRLLNDKGTTSLPTTSEPTTSESNTSLPTTIPTTTIPTTRAHVLNLGEQEAGACSTEAGAVAFRLDVPAGGFGIQYENQNGIHCYSFCVSSGVEAVVGTIAKGGMEGNSKIAAEVLAEYGEVASKLEYLTELDRKHEEIFQKEQAVKEAQRKEREAQNALEEQKAAEEPKAFEAGLKTDKSNQVTTGVEAAGDQTVFAAEPIEQQDLKELPAQAGDTNAISDQDGDKSNNALQLAQQLSQSNAAMDNSFAEFIEDDQSDDVDLKILADALNSKFNKQIRFAWVARGAKSRYVKLATTNAQVALQSKLKSEVTAHQRIEALESLLGISGIERMECYDISHTMGEHTVASCVVFNREGPDTSRYRRYNITGIKPGDDYAAMHQVLSRRFKDPDNSELPQLIFIDGGKGQLAQAEDVLTKSFANTKRAMPLIVAVAKGEGRKEGLETLIIGFSHESINLSLSDLALQLVIHIRDESHRFAITGHRAKRAKAQVTSKLESISGVGPKKRQALLQNLGGMQEVLRASVDELKKVPGISEELANKIYDELHSL